MDFSKPIFENRQRAGRPFLAAHRGVCGANVPCNTLAAYGIALDQGADVVEIDVTRSRDGEYFAFHPGMEPMFLSGGRRIPEMTACEVADTPLLNFDNVDTHYRVPRLADVLALLKGKAYINVDKFWMDPEGITAEIRRAGVEAQVIIKTSTRENELDGVEKYAPDLMFMPIIWHKDELTPLLARRNIALVGVEALFDSDADDIISDGYIRSLHERGLLIWTNAIIYNEADVIAAGHTDDVSVTGAPQLGWGWLADKNVDFIQTDWLLALKLYLSARK